MKVVCLICILLVFGLSTCQKEDTIPFDSLGALVEIMMAESEMNAVIEIVFDAQDGKLDGNSGAKTENCTNITGYSSSQLSLDFGSGCNSKDGRNRKGKINAQFSGRARSVDSEMQLSFDTYSSDNYRFSGKLKVSNVRRNPLGNIQYTYSIENSKITNPKGKSWLFRSQKNVEWLEGSNTRSIEDDTWKISGSSEGETADQKKYSLLIKDSWLYQTNCWNKLGNDPVKGSAELTIGGTNCLIDWGSGSCDKWLNVIMNGKTMMLNTP
jgi:hypothetical protein